MVGRAIVYLSFCYRCLLLYSSKSKECSIELTSTHYWINTFLSLGTEKLSLEQELGKFSDNSPNSYFSISCARYSV